MVARSSPGRASASCCCLLDNATVPYSEVKAVAPMYRAVVAEGWGAERLLELFNLGEGGRAPLYYVATCTARGRCAYHPGAAGVRQAGSTGRLPRGVKGGGVRCRRRRRACRGKCASAR
jgi:hypothetical protein